MQKFTFLKALCLSALLCLGGCTGPGGMNSSQMESSDTSVTNAFGMKMDVTTKQQAKDILKKHGYTMILEAADLRNFLSKRKIPKIKNERMKDVFEKGTSVLLVPVSTDFEKNIQLFFDKDQKLIMFLVMARDEKGKLKPNKEGIFRKDFSFEFFEKTDSGNMFFMIVSPKLVKRSAERHLNQ